MIKPILYSMFSPDVPNNDLEHYVPEDPDNFGIFVQTLIGPENSDGRESFGFIVCSPQWLANELTSEPASNPPYLFARHHLILPKYDLATIRQAIMKLCDDAERQDWDHVGEYLSRFGDWEFEDYPVHI